MKDINNLNISYEFKNEELLKTALTHSSYSNENKEECRYSNERLEFLGDAVLDLVVGEYFFKQFKVREGQLSMMRAKVVKESSIAKVAKKINLGDAILLGKGEEKNNGREKLSILADSLEALIGAIYLDSSFDVVKEFILEIMSEELQKAHESSYLVDYKSRLQEVCQMAHLNIEYVLEKTNGPLNSRVFYSKVIVDGKTFGRGEGNSIKKSEQMAAKDALSKGNFEWKEI